MNQRKAGILLAYVCTATHIIANLLYIPILLNRIGQDEYGLYQLVGSLISYLSMMESLLSTGVLRYYCKYNSIGNEEKKENVLYISRKIYTLLSFAITLAGIICVFVFQIVYESTLTKHELSEAVFMVVILIVTIIINLMSAVYTAAITANEKFVFLKIILICTNILQPIVVLFAVKRVPYAITVVIVQFVMCAFTQAVTRYYAINKLNIKIKFHYRDKEFEKDLFSLSFSILLVTIADQIFWKTDQLIIGKIMGTAAVAVYSVGAQIYLNYSPIGTSISSVFMPRLSMILDQQNDMEEVSNLFIKTGRISFMILSFVLIGFGLYGKEFISIWAGSEYMAAYYIAIIIMIPLTVDVMQNMGLTILQIKGKYSFRGKIYLAIALANIATTIYLVQHFGIIGAAVSTSIAMGIGNGLIMNIYYKKVLGLDITRFWKEILSILPSTIISFGMGLIIRQISIYNPWLELGIHVGIFTIFYSMILYAFSLNQYEKMLINMLLKKLNRKHTC